MRQGAVLRLNEFRRNYVARTDDRTQSRQFGWVALPDMRVSSTGWQLASIALYFFSMAYDSTAPLPPFTGGNEMEAVFQQCMALLGEYSETAATLRASLKETEDRIAEITTVRDEAHAVLSQAASVRQQAERLQLFGPTPRGSHLRVAPDETAPPPADDAEAPFSEPAVGTMPPPADNVGAPVGEPAADTASDSQPSADAHAPNTDTGTRSTPDVVVIRGPRLRQILDVMGSKPGINWNSEDLAVLLGMTKDDSAGRHSLRQSLRALAERGALERVKVAGDWHTYYRPLMNWKFI